MTQTNIWWYFWRGCFSGFCAFECQLVLCAAVQNLCCSPIGGVKDALEWKDFSRWEEISPTETEIYARLSVFPPNTNTDLHPHLQCCLACTFLLSFLGGGESLSKKTVYKCRNEYKKKTKETFHLHVVFCRTYSSLDSTFKLPIASFTKILATSSVLVLSFIQLSSFELLRTSKWYNAYNKFCKNIWWNLGICPNHQASRRFHKVLFKAIEYFRFCEAIVAKLIPREHNSL